MRKRCCEKEPRHHVEGGVHLEGRVDGYTGCPFFSFFCLRWAIAKRNEDEEYTGSLVTTRNTLARN